MSPPEADVTDKENAALKNIETLIIGGTGQVGRELISLLTKTGTPTRALVRSTQQATLQESELLQLMKGDLSVPASLEKPLEGIQRVFLLTRDQPQQGKLESEFIEQAKQSGVTKIVKSSAFAAALQPPPGYGIGHAESEKTLMDSGLDWSIIRPFVFMQNFLELAELARKRSVLPLPMGQARIAMIDARDVALAASHVLMDSGHSGRCYQLTGPDPLTIAECAEILSGLLQRKINYRSPPFWFAGLMMRLQGVSRWDVAMRKQLFKMVREGGEAQTSAHFEEITGSLPRSISTFFEDHLSEFG